AAVGYFDTIIALLKVDIVGFPDPTYCVLKKKPLKNVEVKVDGGATVTLVDGDGKSYTETDTDRDGSVTLPNVPVPTTGTVTVEANGKTVKVPVRVDKDGNMSPSDLKLYQVTVKVVELGATPEKPIAGATVTAGGQTSAATDADGVATLHLVKGVDYEDTKAEASGYTERTVKLEVKADGSVKPDKIELAKTGSHSVNFTVDKGATVTVSDPINGAHTATAGPNDTQVSVPGVPDVATGGTVTVKATVDGQERVVTVPVKVENGVATPSDLTLHVVTVKVVEKDASPEVLIAGATVAVGGQSVTAGSNGEATLHLVKGVTYSDLGAAATGYTAISGQTLTVDGGGHATPDKIELTKAGQSDPYLHVFVVDENLRAIDGVSVSVNVSGEEPRVTDRAGHAAWQLKADGKYELTLKKDEYVTVTTSVKLDVRGHDLTVVMQRVAQADPKKEDPKGPVTAVESELLAGASLYPNPAREYTTLQGIEHAEMVSILTLSGVEVQRLAVPGEREHKLDVSSLAEGIYLVVPETRGGERRTLKLVVRR
ncbi:MAG: T9SS type A sorting domain-containing protein, partial [Bacteroidia bacterium]|nr:T9SS type A sorting domain-containing protein [Bacteroidia bacterium]